MASPIVRLNFCCTGKRATKGALELKDYMFNSMGRKEIGSDVLTGCSRGEFFDILERCWDILAARLWVMISDFLRPLCCVVERSELMTESARRSDEKLSPDSIWQLIFWQTAFACAGGERVNDLRLVSFPAGHRCIFYEPFPFSPSSVRKIDFLTLLRPAFPRWCTLALSLESWNPILNSNKLKIQYKRPFNILWLSASARHPRKWWLDIN